MSRDDEWVLIKEGTRNNIVLYGIPPPLLTPSKKLHDASVSYLYLDPKQCVIESLN